MLKSCVYCGRIHDSKFECDKRRAAKEEKWGRRRGSEAERVHHSSRWKRLAASVRERDGNLCRHCLSQAVITTAGLSVHHIVPIEEDPTLALDSSNCITLCKWCHEDAEAGKIERKKLRDLIPAD